MSEPSDVGRLACGIMRCILAPGHHGPHHPGDTWKSHEQQQPPSDVERAAAEQFAILLDIGSDDAVATAAKVHRKAIKAALDRLTRELREAKELKADAMKALEPALKVNDQLADRAEKAEAEVADLRVKLQIAQDGLKATANHRAKVEAELDECRDRLAAAEERLETTAAEHIKCDTQNRDRLAELQRENERLRKRLV